MELTKNHSRSKEAYTMNSIEEVFDNSNQLIDGIHHFFDRYIGNSVLRKSVIHKIVDKIMSKGYE